MALNPYSYFHSALYRFKDLAKGTGIYKILMQLQKEQFLSSAELEELQAERLRRLLRHARKQSPYYRQLFDRHGIEIGNDFGVRDLTRIPLLCRENVQGNLETILAENAGDRYLNSSGGSTGNPVNFYQDYYYVSYADAANLLFRDWMDFRPGDKMAVFWGADRDFKNRSLRSRFWHQVDRIRALNSFAMTEKGVLEFLDLLDRFRPRHIMGYAGSLYLSAQIINNRRPIKFAPVSIRSSAEMLYDFQREEIERAFKTRVFNFYGSREVNNLAAECGAHEGLHIFSSGRILEIVDDLGRPVPDGVSGHVVVTDLTNFTFPFIRYLNGDVAVRKTRNCPCGRGYPLLERIQGRVTDMIVINGSFIHGEYFTHLFYKRPDIKQFQVVQEDEKTIRIKVVCQNQQPCLDDILNVIRQKVGDGINIELEFTDNIATTGSGKYRFTISKVKNGNHRGVGESNFLQQGGAGS